MVVLGVLGLVKIGTKKPGTNIIEEKPGVEETVMRRADEVVLGLMEQNMQKVAEMIGPNSEVVFWPYGNAVSQGVRLTRDGVNNWWKDEKRYVWGTAAGSGKEIKMNKKDYFNRYIYDKDFAGAEVISFDRVTKGADEKAIRQAFPGAHWVEYYFSGFNPKYEGMDWESLKLVFEEKEGNWWLGGIIHDQWTP